MKVKAINSLHQDKKTTNWVVKYLDQDSKEHWKRFKTKVDAEIWIKEQKIQKEKFDFSEYNQEVDSISWFKDILCRGASHLLKTHDEEFRQSLRVVSSLASAYSKFQDMEKITSDLEVGEKKIEELLHLRKAKKMKRSK